MNYKPYLNRKHDYKTCNCMMLIADIYEKELNIVLNEEKNLFNNFSINNIKELRKIPIEDIFNLQNWNKIALTDLKEFDIIVYMKNNRLSHFSMYAGEYKILDLVEGSISQLKHLNDITTKNIYCSFRHKSMAP